MSQRKVSMPLSSTVYTFYFIYARSNLSKCQTSLKETVIVLLQPRNLVYGSNDEALYFAITGFACASSTQLCPCVVVCHAGNGRKIIIVGWLMRLMCEDEMAMRTFSNPIIFMVVQTTSHAIVDQRRR